MSFLLGNTFTDPSLSDGMFTSNPFQQPDFNTIEPDTFQKESLQEFNKFVEDTLRQEEYQRFIADNFYDTSYLDQDAEEDPQFTDLEKDDTFQMILDSILGQAEDIPPEIRGDELKTQQFIRDQLAILASQQGNNEEIVDINQASTTTIDNSTIDTDTTQDSTTIPDYSEFVNEDSAPVTTIPGVGSVGTGVTATTPTTPMTPPPGSAGVIIDIEDLMNANDWTVFLPGVIPGLPSSPTIIGTIEDILNKPGDVLGDLWDDLKNTVANPEQVLEDILNGATDSDGLITIGGIQSVISDILTTIEGDSSTTPSTIATEQDPTIIGTEPEPEPEPDPNKVIKDKDKVPDDVTPLPEIGGDIPKDSLEPEPELKPDPNKEIKDKDKVSDDVTPLPDVGGDIPISDSPEPKPEIGEDDTEDAASAGGGDGGSAEAKKFMDVFPYQPVAVPELILPNQSLNYSPVPVRSSRNDFLKNSIVAGLFGGLY